MDILKENLKTEDGIVNLDKGKLFKYINNNFERNGK